MTARHRCRAFAVLLALPLALTLAAGCVEHRATLEPSPEHAATVVAPGLPGVPLDGALVSADPLPVQLLATAWVRLPDGRLARGDVDLRTPRRWWQRFPCDLVSDLLVPATLVCRSEATITLEAVPTMPAADLRAAAIAAGYGGSESMIRPDHEGDDH